MKHLSLLTVVLFSILFHGVIFAQNQSGPAIGNVIGIINDSATKEGLEFIVITVLTEKDSLAKGGGLSDKTGSFNINQLPAGKYFLRISFIGYSTFYSPVFTISSGTPQYDAGKISLAAEKHTMAAVDIVDQKSDYVNGVDKKVYEVAKNPTTAGGTATDVLQTIPSVTVDIDGNVSMRGSGNVTILIDGKPSGLTGDDKTAALSQIPASMIERIEVISNPSARYDAQGMSGIINIVTKKDSNAGFNGSATIGAGTNNKYNAAVTLNNRTKKMNITGNYTFRSDEKWGNNGGEQHTFTTDTNYYYRFTGGGLSSNVFHNGKLGLDFYLNAYNTLSLSGSFTNSSEIRDDSSNYTFLDENLNAFSSFQRNTWTKETSKSIEATTDYKKTFAGSGRVLTASGNFSTNEKITGSNFMNDFMGWENPPYQSNSGLNDFITASAQSDYTHPFNDSMRFEAGVKYGLRHNNNLQQAKTYDYSDSAYFFDVRYSDHFVFSENIYAAYIQFAAHIRKLDYQAGLRTEYTDFTGASGSTGLNFSNSYLSLFPSAAVRYAPKEGYNFRFTYSRRLNRPANRQINPFMDYSDSISVRTGNPYLQAEFIHSIETEFIRSWTQSSLSTTVYYRHTDNMISMSRIFDTLTGRGLVMPRNFSTSDIVGVDLIFRISIGKKGNIMATLSGNSSTVNGENIQAGLQSTQFGWNAKLSGSYKVLAATSVTLTGNYGSPMIQPLGSFQMPGGVDIGFRQDLFKNRATVTVNLADIFDTKRMNMRSYNTGYDLTAFRKKESRILMATFSWRFGSAEELKKRGNQPIPQPSDDSQGGGF